MARPRIMKVSKSRYESVPPSGVIRSRGRSWWPMWLALGIVFLGSGAWAYQEWRRAPAPLPPDAIAPEPVTEPMSRFVPAASAVYVRGSLQVGWLDQLVRAVNASGALGEGGASRGQVLQGLVMGLHALMGYPLMTGEGAGGIEAMMTLGSPETAARVGQLLEGLDSFGCSVYPDPWRREMPRLVWIAHPRPGVNPVPLMDGLKQVTGASWSLDSGHIVHRDGPASGALSQEEAFGRAMAGLPDDRVATVYADAAALREMLGPNFDPASGLPDLDRLLARLQAEGADRAHYGFAMTHRLGLFQTFTATDWQVRDAAALQAEAMTLLPALMSRIPSIPSTERP